MSRQEFWLAIVVLFTVLTLDTLPAIILGVIISLGILVYRVSFPQTSELGRDRVTGTFESRKDHEEAERIPGVVVYRFEAPLIYANASTFGEAARELVDAADPPARALIVDCEEMFEVDFTGAEALRGLAEDMQEQGLDVRLARVHDPVLERLLTSGVIAALGDDKIFARVEDAVAGGS